MKSLIFLITLVLATFVSAADLPRVAVVPDSPEPSVAAFADFLSVSLASASNQYTLVERAELIRLASEAEVQKLAADQRPVALAKLAKADGLIIVGADKGDPKLPKLTLRLTSTNNGLVLRSLILGGKQDEYPKAAELAAGVLRFPCERLTHGDAKPPVIVSLLGIRPAFEIDRALETTLNLAVAQQLSAQSGIAVSERWKMHDLVFERSLADEKPQSFATGTVLLDGSYTRKGDQLEFSLRLRKAEAEAGKTLTLQGPVNKPTDLALQIAKLVATESGQSGEVVAWNALEEGKQYAELGSWLFARKFSFDAAQATESAIALGYLENGALWTRSAAYLTIFGDWSSYSASRTEVDGLEKLSPSEFKQRVNFAIRKSQCLFELLDARWAGCRKDYDSSAKQFHLRVHLDSNLKVLQSVCLRVEQLTLATEARTLRMLTREIVRRGKLEFGDSFAGDIAQRFYMHDTVEAAAADLRNLLYPDTPGNDVRSRSLELRNHFWLTSHDLTLWRFVDWTATDNKHGEAAWKAFIGECRSSKELLHQVDALAFACQTTRDPQEKEKILLAYADLLDGHFDELLGPQGQMSLRVFRGYFSTTWRGQVFPSFNVRIARLLTRMVESGVWLEPATINFISSSVRDWSGVASKGDLAIPESNALSLLDALEKHIQRAKSDTRWKQLYQDSEFGDVGRALEEIPAEIIRKIPGIKEMLIASRPPLTGAVSIRAWKPEGAGISDSKNWLFGEVMISSGDSLFVPRIKDGIIELNVRTMSVSRLISLPLQGFHHIGGITSNGGSIMMNMENRLFLRPLADGGKSWVEIQPPGVTTEDSLTWCIRGFEDGFFVGSCLTRFEAKSPRMLAGMARDGKIDWLAASNRNPPVNPLDKLDPRSVWLSYRNIAGKTMVLLGNLRGLTPLVELESGREVSSLAGGGVSQMRGEMPLYWNFGTNRTERGIRYLVAFDPAREQPRLLFKSARGATDLPDVWKNVPPVHDSTKPEFQGKFICGVVHGGYLWLLQRRPEEPSKFDENDPEGFCLIRANLEGEKAVTIPLHYDLPEDIRKMGGTSKMRSLDHPIINARSLTDTSKGLFFASSGYENVIWAGGRAEGGDLAPVLLYVTWEDIHTWLAKNAPESSKPASP